MTQSDLLSINTVAARLDLSVHQLRRWELMFGLEIKRGRGQQRQYRPEDLSVIERIKELVEQGWPTSQVRPQLEAEGLVSPKLIGLPVAPGNPEVLMESIIGFRNFAERRFIELSKQIDELRQLLISVTLKQELSGESASPWQPMQTEFVPEVKHYPAEEIKLGPAVNVNVASEDVAPDTEKGLGMGLGEITDQNYLTILGRALDLIGWSDEQADAFSMKSFNIAHWDELGRSQAERLIQNILSNLQEQTAEVDAEETAAAPPEPVATPAPTPAPAAIPVATPENAPSSTPIAPPAAAPAPVSPSPFAQPAYPTAPAAAPQPPYTEPGHTNVNPFSDPNRNTSVQPNTPSPSPFQPSQPLPNPFSNPSEPPQSE
ncbi:MAG: helix-turn-helix domain-containing protein [Candidatus Obscuribacterales bacterium]|nr:helix-turn-helix domain-containing protein [Candidatus Obscuribacterales bacterium]